MDFDTINTTPRPEAITFSATGSEYFRIWIVNLLLSIVTLGVYSAWAKVRREQFFHRNLLLDKAGFDYHAQPMAILRGRGIAAALTEQALEYAEAMGYTVIPSCSYVERYLERRQRQYHR